MKVKTLLNAALNEEGGEAKTGQRIYDIDLEMPARSVEAALDFSLQNIAGLPSIGDVWSTSYPDLYLLTRDARIIGGGSAAALIVECGYRLLRFTDTVPESGQTTLEQVTAHTDRLNDPIYVENQDGVAKRASLDVPMIKATWREEIVIRELEPQVICNFIANKVNSTTFRGYAAGTVVCTNVDYESLARFIQNGEEVFWYDLRADFEVREPNWQYPVTFLESDKTPSGDPTYVEWHKPADFNNWFTG